MRVAAASSSPQPLLEIDRLADQAAPGVIITHTRRYRVHATISVLSVPLFSKDNVGGACAIVEEAVCGPSRTTALQFAGGSWPERLKGFNRFGMTQEAVSERGEDVLESAYLSFMTTSAERISNRRGRRFAAALPFCRSRWRTARPGDRVMPLRSTA